MEFNPLCWLAGLAHGEGVDAGEGRVSSRGEPGVTPQCPAMHRVGLDGTLLTLAWAGGTAGPCPDTQEHNIS